MERQIHTGPSITQIKAARSLLNWTQDDLALRANISKYSVANTEVERTTPQKATLDKIVQALELAGIEFIEDGVRLRKDSITIIDGDGWYLRLLDDVHHTLIHHENPELLIEFADESKSPPEVVEKVIAMRKDGIKMRLLICEGDTYIMGPLEEYRYIPKKNFMNYVSIIYGEKIAVCTEGNVRAVVIKDPLLNLTRKNMFNLAWDILKKPTKSDAAIRFEGVL